MKKIKIESPWPRITEALAMGNEANESMLMALDASQKFKICMTGYRMPLFHPFHYYYFTAQ